MKPKTFEQYLDAIKKEAVKDRLTHEQAAWLFGDKATEELCVIGWRIQNTPKRVYNAILAGIAHASIRHHCPPALTPDQTRAVKADAKRQEQLDR